MVALGTDTGELQLIADDAAAGSCFIQHALGQGHMFQVQNLTAVGADKVGVGFRAVVEPLQAVDNADGLNDILLFEHGNIPVDRTQTQVGEIGFQLPVDPFGGGMAFGTDAKAAAEVTKAVKAVTTKPVILKLSPNVTDIVSIAKACEEAGADGISLINTLLGMRIDLRTKKPLLANGTGGFSGPAVKPVAIRMVYQVRRAVKVPILGLGGIMTGEDAAEFLMAGADAVAVGTAALVNPTAPVDVVEGLRAFMEQNGYENIAALKA